MEFGAGHDTKEQTDALPHGSDEERARRAGALEVRAIFRTLRNAWGKSPCKLLQKLAAEYNEPPEPAVAVAGAGGNVDPLRLRKREMLNYFRRQMRSAFDAADPYASYTKGKGGAFRAMYMATGDAADAANDRAVAVVVESRKDFTAFNTAVRGCVAAPRMNAAAPAHATYTAAAGVVNGFLAPLCRRFDWDGTDPKLKKQKNVVTAL